MFRRWMTECMRWLYDHYILPQIEGRPMDDGDASRAALFWDARAVLAFYAVQGFRLGARTGLALGRELEG